MAKGLTEKEREIVLMLKEIENDESFIITSILVAAEDDTTDDLYDFLKENDDLDSDDVLNFLVPGEEDEEQVA